MEQMRLLTAGNPRCPFKHRIEREDDLCFGASIYNRDYDKLAENLPNLGDHLASVRGIDFDDVVAKDIPVPDLPIYLPTVYAGAGKLFTQFTPPYVGVMLEDLVSPKLLKIKKCNLNQITGAPPGTKFILLGYGHDPLLENIHPRRRHILEQLAQMEFTAVTGINYSVWDADPHAERLINIKRSLLTYEIWQSLGMAAIPHIYWSGLKDLDAWAAWLDAYPTVQVIAMNLQTLVRKEVWLKALNDLQYFAGKIDRRIRVLITGASQPVRSRALSRIFPSLTHSNSRAFMAATMHRSIDLENSQPQKAPDTDKSILARNNFRNLTSYYQNLAESNETQTFSSQIQPESETKIQSTPETGRNLLIQGKSRCIHKTDKER